MSRDGVERRSLFRRLVLCRLQMCPHRATENDTHPWGECRICGNVAGLISRAAVRRYIEAEERDLLASKGERS